MIIKGLGKLGLITSVHITDALPIVDPQNNVCFLVIRVFLFVFHLQLTATTISGSPEGHVRSTVDLWNHYETQSQVKHTSAKFSFAD